jgi:uncharacterized membrane protein
MITQEEERFLNYWSEQRLHKKKFLRKLSIGMPLAVLMAVAVMVNVFSGWYERANMVFNSDSSMIIVVLIALIAIVVFITIFSAYHRWDQNESAYQRLLKRKNEEDHVQHSDANNSH